MLNLLLEQTWLTKNEALIYLYLLSFPDLSVWIISKRLSINRNSVYSVIDTLSKKWLVSSIHINNTCYYSSIDISVVIDNIEADISNKRNLKNRLQNEIKKYDFNKHLTSDSRVIFNKGFEWLRSLISDLSWETGQVDSIINPDYYDSKMLKYVSDEYQNLRKWKLSSKSRILLIWDSAQDYKDKYLKADPWEIRIDKKWSLKIDTSIQIYWTKVAIYSLVWDASSYNWAIYKDENFYNSIKSIFNFLWINLQ